MNEYLENQLNKSVVYQQLKDNCERNNQHEVLALVAKVGTFAVERLKTVIKNMPEFTLHDDTHIFNMLTIIGKLIPQENMRKLSTPDLFMLLVSVFLHDIGMAPDEKHILAWKNQLPETEYDEELKEEREKFARFRLTYTHQLADIERLETEQEFSKAQLLEDYIVTEYIRTTHSIRAREVIAKYWAGEIVYQDTDLTEDLATICFSHNESYTYLLQMETFRVCGQDEYLCIPFVATVLRLADIIDFDPKGCIGILIKNGLPAEEIEILSKDVEIDGEIYTLSSNIKYKTNCITETSTSISVDEDGEIDTNTSWSERFKSNRIKGSN